MQAPRPRTVRRTSERVAASGGEQLDSLSLALRSALTEFEAEVSKPDDEIDLARAAGLLAMHADPTLDAEKAVMVPLEQLAAAFKARLGDASDGLEAQSASESPLSPLRLHLRAEALCAFMVEQGFAGCGRTEEGYYDAANSRMDRVLKRRCGIPITLSLVYMEVGRAGGLALQGMGFPGHFLLGFGQGDGAGLLDAFDNRTLTEGEAAKMLGGLYGQPVKLNPSWRTMPRLPKWAFLMRMVKNLQNVYERDENFAQAAQVVQYARRLEAASRAHI